MEYLSKILDVLSNVLIVSIVIMCAACIAAIAVLWIRDELKDKQKDKDDLQSARCSLNARNKSSAKTADAADLFLNMVVEERCKLHKCELERKQEAEHAEQWGNRLKTRIKVLEKQLKDNDITPISWEEMKYESKAA